MRIAVVLLAAERWFAAFAAQECGQGTVRLRSRAWEIGPIGF